MSSLFQPTRPLSIAAVLPRYGASLGGGAETLVRELMLALNDRDRNSGILPIEKLEIWTTCAKDHRTWENAHPPGETLEDGFRVLRFPVDERNLDTFIRAELSMAGGRPLSVDEQLDWLGAGVNSRALYSHISAEQDRFDAILFAPYLFSTTFWGSLLVPDKALVVPCLHNEAYAYQAVFRHLFRRVRGLLYNAEPEMRLACELYGSAAAEKGTVVGMGFSEASAEGPAKVEHRDRSPLAERKGPFLLYSGRKEQGKNLDQLIEWYSALRSELPQLELVIIGSGEISFLEELPPGVFDLGFVSENEKLDLMQDCIALCQPSTNESFSIVIMEAWLREVPVIVHSDCAVTRDHVVKSGGGLHAGSAAELAAVVRMLLAQPELRAQLAVAGRNYVRETYNWPAVLTRFKDALIKCGLLEQPHAAREALSQ
ncbi:MAG: glycosyltransferase family 4 protein [Bdellovibrionota bacterium]